MEEEKSSFSVIATACYIREKGPTVYLSPCPEASGVIFTGDRLEIAEGILSGDLFDKIPLYINDTGFRPLCLKVLSERP